MVDDDAKAVPLKVELSRVSVRGIARMNEAVMESLGLKAKAPIVVTRGGRAVLVHVFGDRFVGKGTIRLRKAAMSRLQVKEGERVSVTPHVTYIESTRKAVKKAAHRIRKGLKRRREQKKQGRKR